MDRPTGIFVDGMGAAAATSGVLTQLQGRIFGLLYLQPGPLSLDDITAELQQSKSNISVSIRGLADWHLVRQVRVAGSRRDHYEAATDFWRVLREIMERRYRWNLRQVLATAAETRAALAGDDPFTRTRLASLEAFFTALDAGVSVMSKTEAFSPEVMQDVIRELPIEG